MESTYQYANWVLIGLGLYMVLMLFIGGGTEVEDNVVSVTER